MPFVANTPESLIARADSRNPNSACRGITANGRPCRRPIAASTSARGTATVVLIDIEPDDLPHDETLYCWQHKDQAAHSARPSPGSRRTSAHPILEERSSLDTLADRLGLVDLKEKARNAANGDQRNGDLRTGEKTEYTPRPNRQSTKTKRPKQAKRSLQFCFCFSMPLDEVNDSPAPRPRPRPRPQPQPVQQQQQQQRPRYSTSSAPLPSVATPSKESRQRQHSRHSSHGNSDPKVKSSRHRLSETAASPGQHSYRSARSSLSQTAQIKTLIPDSLDAAAASALMTELAKPPVESEEPGYIYMFWLTPASAPVPAPVDAARSLLAPPSVASTPRNSRRASDVVSSFADQAAAAGGATGTGKGHKTMLLKIGRAANVQRRMNQWQRQCGYDIEMLRYYPYLPSTSPTDSPHATASAPSPAMTLHPRKVERLVHIELTGMDLRASLPTCEACGRDHREWFEVAASRDAIRRVDEVIRRWIDWDDSRE